MALPRALENDEWLGLAQSGRQTEQLEISLFDRGAERPILTYALRGAVVASYSYSKLETGGDEVGTELLDLWFDSATVDRAGDKLEIEGDLRDGVPPIQTVATCAAGSTARLSASKRGIEDALIGAPCIQIGRRVADGPPVATLGARTVDDASTAFSLTQAHIEAGRFDSTVELRESGKPVSLRCDDARVRQADLIVTPSSRFQLECKELRIP